MCTLIGIVKVHVYIYQLKSIIEQLYMNIPACFYKLIKEHKNLNVYPFWWHNWLEFQTWRLCWHRTPELTATLRLFLHPSSSWPTEYGCLQPWFFILYHCRLLIPFGVSSKSKSNIFPMDPQTSYISFNRVCRYIELHVMEKFFQPWLYLWILVMHYQLILLKAF